MDLTRTNKYSSYPITKKLQEFLEKLKAEHDKYYSEGKFLFLSDNENGRIANNCVYNFYRRMCQKLNIPIPKDLTEDTHTFRQTHITNIANSNGGTPPILLELFKNSSEVIQKKHFTSALLDETKKIVEDASF